jgi:GTP cyclohydrolase I
MDYGIVSFKALKQNITQNQMIANKEKIEQYDEELTASLADNYKTIIADLGEDVNREGLEKTPER